jgi:hypothetical protein
MAQEQTFSAPNTFELGSSKVALSFNLAVFLFEQHV